MFGTGMGTAFFKFTSDLFADMKTRDFINHKVVLADWIFTTPSIFISPITGVSLLFVMNISLSTTWVIWSFVFYMIAGLCWLPAVYMQLSMHKMTKQALKDSSELPEKYYLYIKIWAVLGFIAFCAMIAIVLLMVFKPY